MLPLASTLKKSCYILFVASLLYISALFALTNTWLQRHALYVHKLHSSYWQDISHPEQFGFAKNQVTPFHITTPDNETLYAWHILPLGLYAAQESELLQQPSGLVGDVTRTSSFKLLQDDPETRLIINFHGNAGNVAQGWRTDSYRALSYGGSSKFHILTIDYRGFGLSTGFPTEDGLIIDGMAAVNWALNVVGLPPRRIVILGHSLGTAVACGVAERLAQRRIDIGGVVLLEGFSNLPDLLTKYSFAGFLPILSPIGNYPRLKKILRDHVVDKWLSTERLANFVRLSKRVRLTLIHSRNDPDIPWTESDALFAAAANATTDGGMDQELLGKMKARSTVSTGEGTFVSTWNAGGDKIIKEEIVAYGQHNRILTYAPVTLAVLKAFG